jgi:DNA-binding MarR family transcriptional regulator
MEDVADTAEGVWGALDLATQIKLVLTLVLFWRKLRGVRVNLDRDQFQAMKAVKRNQPIPTADLAAKLGRPPAEVQPVVDALKAMKYRDEITLLEESGGLLRTRF